MKKIVFVAVFFVCFDVVAQEFKPGIYQGRLKKEYQNSVGFGDWYGLGNHKYYIERDLENGELVASEMDFEFYTYPSSSNESRDNVTFDTYSDEPEYEDCPSERHVINFEHINAARWRTTHYLNFQCNGGDFAEIQYSGVSKFYRRKQNYYLTGFDIGEHRSRCFNHSKKSRFFWHLEDGEGTLAFMQIRLEDCSTGEIKEIPVYFKKNQGDRYIDKYGAGIFNKTGAFRISAICSGPCYVEKDMRPLR